MISSPEGYRLQVAKSQDHYFVTIVIGVIGRFVGSKGESRDPELLESLEDNVVFDLVALFSCIDSAVVVVVAFQICL